MARIDVDARTIRNFDTRDGLPSNQQCFARARGEDGTMYLGGFDGLIRFRPEISGRQSVAALDRTVEPALGADRPRLHGFTVATVLPERIHRLDDLARHHARDEVRLAVAPSDGFAAVGHGVRVEFDHGDNLPSS